MSVLGSQEIDELIHLAQEDLSRNRLTSAEKSLEQAILLNNQVPDAFYLLGQVYSKRGKFKKAVLALERALKLDPLHTEASIALSSLYNDMGRYREGASIYQKTKKRLETVAPGHDPRINLNLAKRHAELGNTYLKYERFQEACVEFSKALELEPTSVSYAVSKAKCLSRIGVEDEAIQLLRNTIETHPQSVEARVQLGIFYHTRQNLKEAHRYWQDALALDPENRSAQMYLHMIQPG